MAEGMGFEPMVTPTTAEAAHSSALATFRDELAPSRASAHPLQLDMRRRHSD